MLQVYIRSVSDLMKFTSVPPFRYHVNKNVTYSIMLPDMAFAGMEGYKYWLFPWGNLDFAEPHQ